MLQAVRLAGVEAGYGGGSQGGETNTKKNTGFYVATSVETDISIPL